MLQVYRLNDEATLPSKAYEGDAGWDLYSMNTEPINVGPHSDIKIPTGWSFVIPSFKVALIRDKSGVSTKQKLSVVAGVIDSNYTGEIIVVLHNRSDSVVTILPKQKIAQVILVECDTSQQVIELYHKPETERGDGGFGSTGIH